MRLLLTLLLFWFGFAPAWCQSAPPPRLEIRLDEAVDEAHRVVPLGQQGAILIHHTQRETARQPHLFRFTRLDTALTTRWKSEYNLPEKMVPLLSFVNDQAVFYLSAEPNSNKFSILRVNLDDGTTDTYQGLLPGSLTISEFRVLGNRAYLAGYNRQRPVVLGFSFFDGNIRVFQGLFLKNVEIGSIDVDEFREEIHVVTHTLSKRCQFTLRSYSPDGIPLRTVEFGGSEYSLISGKLLPISADESLLVGNYSADCMPYSQGIYLTRIRHTEGGNRTPTPGDSIRYVDFSSLTNFFNYLRPRRQERLKARVELKKKDGKEFRFRYRLMVHDLLPTPNGLQLLAEVYYPQYRGSASPYMAGTWRGALAGGTQSGRIQQVPMNTMRPPADRYNQGYQYTHAFVCEFDRQGSLLWDNCLPIKELTDDFLVQKVQISSQKDRLVLAYAEKDEVRAEVIRRDSVLLTVPPLLLGTGSAQEKVAQADHQTLTAWFGPYFLTSGYQRIVAERGFATPPRDVFYVSRLRIDAHNVPAPPKADPRPQGR